ncbi:hypothetical protein GOBAR_AA23598 [Gossypium barbadense]|uniref:Uncharacterized protein n=1 Tax=Gossypium barbadense TaxID=3634 RepID=A0A2P5X145_GOSBA|nr:hypothetical protein GOBAR_AA23598 [Gossypium barbadense]
MGLKAAHGRGCRKPVKKARNNEHHLWKKRDSAAFGQKALNLVKIKYKLYLGLSSVVALGSKDPSYLRIGPLDGFGYFCTLTGPGRISNASLPSYQPGGMFGRLNSSTTLSLHGISFSVIQPGHSQTSINLINGSRKIQLIVYQQTRIKMELCFKGSQH